MKIKGSETPAPVRDLIAKATEKGIDAHVVDIETYDTALLRIWRNLENVPDELDAKVRKGKAGIVSIPLPDTTGVKPILRMNALPVIQLPSNCLEVKTKTPLDWRSLKEILREAETDILATIDDGLIAWGEADEIASTFGSDFVGVSERSFDSDWRSTGRLSRKRFLEDALAKSFVRDRPVLFRRRGASAYLIIDKMAQDLGPIEALHRACGATTGTITGLTVPESDEYEAIHKVDFAEAARISLAYGDDRLWLLINPDIWIWPPRARKTAKNWLDRRRSGRRNDRHDAILSAWVSLLADDVDRNKPFSVSLFDGEVTAQNPAFELVNRTGFAWKRGAP